MHAGPDLLLRSFHHVAMLLEEVREACGTALKLVPSVHPRRADTQHAYAWHAGVQSTHGVRTAAAACTFCTVRVQSRVVNAARFSVDSAAGTETAAVPVWD
jgi:hypothetical protein